MGRIRQAATNVSYLVGRVTNLLNRYERQGYIELDVEMEPFVLQLMERFFPSFDLDKFKDKTRINIKIKLPEK